ncbi:MAG TPA: aldolase/citrate lyase family protein, partial [Candidatus Saccharimonadales bacterium]|nr:aldolase/citrate lyase family protein [Candidatus Saccharimonadales bacterium]
GRLGAEVRSDLHVALEPRTRGGLEIELHSKVEVYYGEALRTQARAVLRQLGVAHARVVIHDAGALPFTVAARLEAAARRAGLGAGRRALPAAVARPAPSARDRLRRSRLYLPGNEPRFMANAGLYHADAVILDLEDSVHPSEKDAARVLVRDALRGVDFGAAERMVRINQLPAGLEDLDEVMLEQPDVVLIPKVEQPAQVAQCDRRIRAIQRRGKLKRPTWLMPILESALGVEHAFAIAGASDLVVALTIGLEDYTADMGVVKTREGEESRWARLRLVNAARAAGVQAIDSVYGDVGDLDGLRAWGERARGLGFEGMGCVHPRQIEVIHAAFAPRPAEVERALKIVAAFQEARARGLAVTSLGSKMIDPPVVNRALKLVKQARAMGLVAEAEVKV